MGPLSRDSGFRFKVTAWGIIKGSNYLVGWLLETWPETKRWLTTNECGMPGLSQYIIEEGIQRLREIGMLEWV